MNQVASVAALTKGDLIPDAEVEGLIAELQEVFARHNAGPALSAKAVFKPTPEGARDWVSI